MTVDISDIRRRFGADFGRYAVSSLVPAVLGVVLIKLLTVAFPPASYGRYSLTLSYVAIGSTLVAGWLGQAILRFGPELDEDVLLSTVLFAVSGIGVVVTVGGAVSWVLVGSHLGVYRPFFVCAVGLVGVQSVYQVARKLLQSRLDSRSAAGLTVLRSVVRFGFGVGIALFVFDGIVGWFVGAIVGTVLSLFVFVGRGVVPLVRPRYHPAVLRQLFRFGLPMVGWLFGFTVLSFIDRTLIEVYLGSAAVGIYAANYDIANKALPLVVGPVIQAAHPIIMNAWSGDNPSVVRQTITAMTRYYLLVATPVTVAVVVAARPLSALLVGPSFRAGHTVIPFVALGVFVWNGAMIGHKGLEITDNTLLLLGGVLGACLFNVLANAVLLVRVGIVGAAIATLGSFLAYLLFVYLVSSRYIAWRIPWRTVATVSAGVAVQATLCVIGLRAGGQSIGTLLIVELVGFGAYVTTLGVLDEFRHSEIATARRLLYQLYPL